MSAQLYSNLVFVGAFMGLALVAMLLVALLISSKQARIVGIVLGVVLLVGIILTSCSATSQCPAYQHHTIYPNGNYR